MRSLKLNVPFDHKKYFENVYLRGIRYVRITTTTIDAFCNHSETSSNIYNRNSANMYRYSTVVVLIIVLPP